MHPDPLRRQAHARRALTWLLLGAIATGCTGRSDAAPGSKPAADVPAGPAARLPHTEGDTISRVALSEAAYAAAGIAVEPVGRLPAAAQTGGLQVPAQIAFDPARVALITPRAPGRIERLTVVEGDRVSPGQAVAYLSSPDFLTAQTDFVQARRRAAMLAGTPDAEGGAALAVAARRRLELLGVPAGVIAGLQSGAEPAGLLPILAPFGGSIVQSMALAGAAVEPGTPIFRIADLRMVNAVAQVPEQALVAVHEGQQASVSVPAFPGQLFPGRVTRLQTELDSVTRTVRAVVRVPNPARRLRVGMFATVQLAAPLGGIVAANESDSVLTIPERAVVTEGERRYVFVEVAPRTFERRAVEVVPLAPPGGVGEPGARMVVRSGLRAGDRVVVDGAFTLQSELGKSTFGEPEG